jgi:hypothetical protein
VRQPDRADDLKRVAERYSELFFTPSELFSRTRALKRLSILAWRLRRLAVARV